MPGLITQFTQWDVVLVLIALVGLIKVFTEASEKWTKMTTQLDVTLKELAKCVEEFKNSNSKTHERIFSRLSEHSDTLSEHDIRITKLETKEEAKHED